MIEMMNTENYTEMKAGEITMMNAETGTTIGHMRLIVTHAIEPTIMTFLVDTTETRLYFFQVTVSMRITTKVGKNVGINY